MADLSSHDGPEVFREDVIAKACQDVRKMLMEQYYASWDTAQRYEPATDAMGQPVLRPKLWYLYSDEATVVWNGHPYSKNDINTLLAQMPITKHSISCLDVQPVQDAHHAMVSIHGTCLYGDTVQRSFHQQFITETDGEGQMRLLHDCFRWLCEDEAR
eukprot:TRINITY_DN1127_c0_g4_i2.p2 TRINITY_DN1127_c0_g4~~TRINITY_DN1127_c0_g4_i2.p2  ORF type:complete len:158 (+),score=55.17 TRINITY_DN1127_c0_g4_i2:171-644(+)